MELKERVIDRDAQWETRDSLGLYEYISESAIRRMF